MTKPFAPVFVPSQERPSKAVALHASRWLLVGSALALAACSSTPLPPWNPVAAPAPSPTQHTTLAKPGQPSGPSITPIAPSSQLQPLPYSGAIAALYPDPTERYNTPGLADGRRSFTTNAELADVLRDLAQKNSEGGPRLGLLDAGNAQSGTPLLALVATTAKAISPLALDETTRPNVLIVAGQQGNAPASTEAVLALAQELGKNGLLTPLLEQINIILVPRANPDGFEKSTPNTADGTDLRFDHLQLKTPEARFLAKLARDYRAAVVIDAGEFAAIEPTLQRFAAVRANDIGLQYAVTPNANEFVSKASREWLYQPTANSLKEAGLVVDWAFEPSGTSAESGFAMGTIEPTTLRNASSLKNTASLDVQSRGSDLGRTHAQRRVHSHVKALTAALQSVAHRADDLRRVHTFVTRDVASQACRGTTAIQSLPRMEQRNITLVDASSAQLVQKPAAWTSSLNISTPRTRQQACGYWLSANAVQATELLSMLGVNVQRVAELASLQAESYQAQSSTPTAGSPPAISLTSAILEAGPGSYYVSMNQPLAFLAAAALEPDSTYSYFQTGILRSLADVARVTALPNIVFEEE